MAEIGYVEVLLPPRDCARDGGFSNMFLRKPVNTMFFIGRVLVKNGQNGVTDLSGSPYCMVETDM